MSLYYLLSNNHINDLIVHPFDFSDDEVTAYYVSFLKTLSLKLNQSTLQFFFNADANGMCFASGFLRMKTVLSLTAEVIGRHRISAGGLITQELSVLMAEI